VLVDEFQDTNPLQNEILELLERENLFRVGDEHQSIYGFRHAEVGVFREHADEAAARGRAEKLTSNFRSRGEVLDAIDMAFGSEEVWGDAYEPLREAPGSREPPARVEPCVELLVTDQQKGRWDDWAGDDEDPFGAALHGVPPWRAAEARLLARRIEELIRAGYKPGDVVILLRATTHMAAYDQALQERGVPTYVVGGRGYFSQQQVADLRAYLGALANPLDALAMYSVLASPLVGVSLDGVALIALRARTRAGDVWRTILDGDLEGLPAGDAERIAAFVQRFEAQRAGARRVSLETLIDRAVTESGYDRRVLRMPAGDRRMANVRKLMRMAREYEAEEGRDLRGFIDFVAERDLVQEREGEAPLEAEDVDAVRLMTIHRAKGLEFPVVCVADLGKVGREDTGSIRLTDDGRMGLRLAELSGGSVNSVDLERIKQEQKEADEEEEKRILYVAMTRAEEHLVLSGATDLEKLPPMKPLEEPMRWVWRAFEEGEYEGRPVRVSRTDCSPDVVDEVLPEADRRPEPPPPAAASEEVPDTLFPPELAAVPAPEPMRVSRLSYSSLGDYARCGYRFYLERALRLPGPDRVEIEFEGEGLPGLLRGTVVHELLERLDFRRPAVPGAAAIGEAIERHAAAVADADVEDIAGLIEGFVRSPLRERIARAGRARSELPFSFTLEPAGGGRSLLVNGVVDVLAEEEGGVLVVDYKSDRLDGAEPDALFEEQYEVQRIVYGLAALRSGADRVEVAHVFLERPDEPLSALFERSDAERLERELRALAAGVAGGSFVPTAEPHAALCADCPGQPALCSWGPERTLAEPGLSVGGRS
jgi:ATP-dependent exoDNAse (exonuclease V) beta subunit